MKCWLWKYPLNLVSETMATQHSFFIMYLDRELSGLYVSVQKYSYSGDELYNELIKKLLIDGNHTMIERMQPQLENGGLFVGIGALHLIGE